MRVRMMRSVIKISRTVATANATRKVTKAHVDYAMRFVQDKLDFIKSIHPADLKKIKLLATDITARQDLLKDQFYLKTFSTKEAHKYISESMEGTIAEKTITRDLQKIGAKLLNKKEGTWALGQVSPEVLQKVTKVRRPKKKTTKSKNLKKVTKQKR